MHLYIMLACVSMYISLQAIFPVHVYVLYMKRKDFENITYAIDKNDLRLMQNMWWKGDGGV